MNLPLEVEKHLLALCNPAMLQWTTAGFLVGERRQQVWKKLDGDNALRAGRADLSLPLEQVALLSSRARSEEGPFERMGPVGAALSFLARRYLAFHGGRPRPRQELLSEFCEVRLRCPAEVLGSFRAAQAAREHGADRRARPRPPAGAERIELDWPEFNAVAARTWVDGHVHLGGVLGSEDLWLEFLDPNLGHSRLRHLSKDIDRLGRDRLPRALLARLESLGDLRALLRLRLALRSGPAGEAGLLGNSLKLLSEQVRIESMLLGDPRGASDAVLRAAAATARVTLLPERLLRLGNAQAPELTVGGERRLLFESFQDLLDGAGDDSGWFGPVLGMYVTARCMVHHGVTQHVLRRGFANFLDWHEAGARNLKADEELTRQHAILGRGTEQGRRRLEGRIVPKKKRILSWLAAFRSWQDRGDMALGRDFGLVLHFIKQADPTAKPGKDGGCFAPAFAPRHHRLRTSTRRQAQVLQALRRSDPEVAEGVLAVDAARIETDAGPEVFAPAFRYLRRPLLGSDGRDLPLLRATYHAGESFHHPVSGLRAIHEAMVFCDLRPGDRIGHGMALAIDPAAWLARCGPQPLLPRGERFDDLVWTLHLLRDHPQCERARDGWLSLLAQEFTALYPGEQCPGPYSLLDTLVWAWRLRSMDPQELFRVLENLHWRNGRPPSTTAGCSEPTSHRQDLYGALDSCRQTGCCLLPRAPRRATTSSGDHRTCDASRDLHWRSCRAVNDGPFLPWRLATLDLDLLMSGQVPRAALRLLWHYQFDRGHRKRASEPVHWEPGFPSLAQVYGPLQARVADEVRHRRVTLECCPSSNYRIGAFGPLTQHPVFRFFPLRAADGVPSATAEPRDQPHPLRSMICTDDAGIFATDFSSELALLAHAATTNGADESEVVDWLERLRQQGLQSTFLRDSPQRPRSQCGAPTPPDAAWPPGILFHPDARDTTWYRFLLDDKRRERTLRARAHIRRDLLG